MAIETTNSLASVVTLDQGFVSNEIEDEYTTHLDLNGFCTVDNGLVGVSGDVRKILKYSASGTAVDVAEGAGNSESISTGLDAAEYRVKCAQAWFRYSDEAYMRDPVAVQTGLTHLGTAMFNKVNADITEQFALATLAVTPGSSIGFDAFVDAVAAMSMKDAAGENARDAQNRFIPTVWAQLSKADIAKVRKACKDQLDYSPEHAWTPGYVGEVAGVTLFYRQDLEEKQIYVGTNKAVTVFNKTGVQTEQAARNGGTTGTANLRFNDFYARKYYIAALTDESQIVQIVLSGGKVHTIDKAEGDGTEDEFTMAHTPLATPTVYVNGVIITTGFSYAGGKVTFTTAPADGAALAFEYQYTAS